jgi:hypothetical protein
MIMVKKRKKRIIPDEKDQLYIIPSPNATMQNFITKFKVDMMEHIVSSIEFAIKNKIPIVEVFQFKDSPFVVTINEAEFNTNLSHIHKYYMDHEIYELCPRIEQLQEILKRNPNEKENSEDYNGFNDLQ